MQEKINETSNYYSVFIIIDDSCMWNRKTSHRVILEGFQDAMLGYELHLNKVQFKLLGAVKGIGHDYINVAGNVKIGKIKTIFKQYGDSL